MYSSVRFDMYVHMKHYEDQDHEHIPWPLKFPCVKG